MSHLYLIALTGVGAALLAALLDALWTVSSRPAWESRRPTLIQVETEERRTLALPFVGAERREAAAPVEAPVETPARTAA